MSAPALAAAASLIRDESQEGWFGTHLLFERDCKVQMPGLQVRAGQAIFQVNLVSYEQEKILQDKK
jgi:hypothetical protein